MEEMDIIKEYLTNLCAYLFRNLHKIKVVSKVGVTKIHFRRKKKI